MVFKFWFTFLRDLRLLGRDRSGLVLLFVMPAVLVVVITLVQDNVFKDQDGTRLTGLIIDRDGGPVALDVVDRLERIQLLTLVRAIDGRPPEENWGRAAVQEGAYRFALVLPQGLSAALQERIEAGIAHMFDGTADDPAESGPSPDLKVYFDPSMTGGYRSAVSGALDQAVAGTQAELRMQALERALNQRIAQLNEALEGLTAGTESPGMQSIPRIGLSLDPSSMVGIVETTPLSAARAILPTAVQQNVPAWALFGMFFIAVPLAGGLIRERQQGIADRLRTMPVSPLVLLAGKLCAYACVCLVQFFVILLVGMWLLPWLGTSALALGNDYGALLLVVLCSALAATGFGVLLGSLARTYEQATTVGPIAVVIAAALGGLMVPVFAMPAGMQSLSRISPLAWGHEAFMELFVRGGDLNAVAANLGALLLVFASTLIISIIAARRRSNHL
jgi:ABC-2 type transport system permease protein